MEDRGTYSPKEKYRRMFDDAIGQRMGSMALWRVLDEIGFFTSPASTKYHLSVPGGLLQHSINVAEAAMELCETPDDRLKLARELENIDDEEEVVLFKDKSGKLVWVRLNGEKWL